VKQVNVKSRIGKARSAFCHQLKNIWNSTNLTLNTKIWMFNTTVKSILVYGAETWRTSVTTIETIHQQLSVKNPPHSMASHHQKQIPVGKNQAAASRVIHPPKTLEIDWPYTWKANLLHHNASPVFQLPGNEHLLTIH
jgi:hypothetical protein